MNQTANLRPPTTFDAPDAVDRQRVRIVYEKGESIKFISHQDEFRAWERALRRADVPLLYKQGFNPQPHIQFASPLGVGFSGAREFVDITFSPPLALDELYDRIQAGLPPGLRIRSVTQTELKGPALQTLLIGADYGLEILATEEEVSSKHVAETIAGFLETEECLRTCERKGNAYRYNLRPLVLELRYEGYCAAQELHSIFLRVQQREGATGRPDEVVSALALDHFARRLRREQLYFANEPEHAALFARYPIASKAQVAVTTRGGARGPKRGKSPARWKHDRRTSCGRVFIAIRREGIAADWRMNAPLPSHAEFANSSPLAYTILLWAFIRYVFRIAELGCASVHTRV